MAKKKTTKEVPVEEVKIEEVETVEEVAEVEADLNELKERICEFYGIRDEEILDENSDLSKYDMPK
jgi:hypothetical protein